MASCWRRKGTSAGFRAGWRRPGQPVVITIDESGPVDSATFLIGLPVPILIVTGLVFVMVRLSGDPADLYLPAEASEVQRNDLRHVLELDRPLIIQYFIFLSDLARGDFGGRYGLMSQLRNSY